MRNENLNFLTLNERVNTENELLTIFTYSFHENNNFFSPFYSFLILPRPFLTLSPNGFEIVKKEIFELWHNVRCGSDFMMLPAYLCQEARDRTRACIDLHL